MSCANCMECSHLKCVYLKSVLNNWLCNKCTWVALPFYKCSGAEMLDEASFLDTDLDTDIITVTDQGENGTTLNTSTNPDLLNAARQKNAKGILLCHLNINSIQKKFDELKDIFINNKMQIMAVGETKIDRSYPDSQFLIPGYYLHRNDRKKGGGGVLLFVSSKVLSKRVTFDRSYKTFEPLPWRLASNQE